MIKSKGQVTHHPVELLKLWKSFPIKQRSLGDVRKMEEETDRHFFPLVEVLKYWGNLDCIFIATSRQNPPEICSPWVYPTFQQVNASRVVTWSSLNPITLRTPSVWWSLRKWKLSRSFPWVNQFPCLTIPQRVEISQGQDSESAWEEMISLVGTLWGLYVLYGKYSAIFLQRGKKQNKNSIPGRDLESHNLGRECS